MPGYGYPYPPAPGYGYPPPPVPGPVPVAERRGGRTALLVVLVVLLAAGLGGGLVWALSGGKPGTTATPPSTAAPGGDATAAPPPPSEPDAPQSSGAASDSPSADQDAAGRQAKALDDLLTRNSGARQQVGNAVATVQSCPDSASMRSAAKVFEQAATQREQLIGELDSLDLGALDGGQDAAQLLRTAWQQSADADRAYGRWADAVIADGCPDGTAPRTSDREQGDAISGRASKSKQSFVIRWNPIANRYGLASRTGDGI
ncbi:hypothetical protein C7M71_007645 [Peterkaempfera bronchialis]|uniref:Uncharacterized protein n=1 Tax=Peterkaempfera bronchialis TaxID=2126346 RepID=A0A345SUC8_9ACTN|nr:hypothetical protein C7M71_007645 [Peterkaempfera bronchialis]